MKAIRKRDYLAYLAVDGYTRLRDQFPSVVRGTDATVTEAYRLADGTIIERGHDEYGAVQYRYWSPETVREILKEKQNG